MTTFNEKEKQFIMKYFGSEQIFRTYCKDYIQLNKLADSKTLSIEDDFGFSTVGEDGVTTGIVVQAYYDEELDEIVLCLFIDGKIRVTYADMDTTTNLFNVQCDLMDYPGSYSVEEVENFVFVQNKPFILSVDEDITTLIKPLDFGVYDEALALNEKYSVA